VSRGARGRSGMSLGNPVKLAQPAQASGVGAARSVQRGPRASRSVQKVKVALPPVERRDRKEGGRMGWGSLLTPNVASPLKLVALQESRGPALPGHHTHSGDPTSPGAILGARARLGRESGLTWDWWLEGTVSVHRSPARQPRTVSRGAEHLKSPPCAIGRPGRAELLGRRAQLEWDRAGGQGPELRARGGGKGGRGALERRWWQPMRWGAPAPQQVLDQETLAQVAKAGRRWEVEKRRGSHHVPVRAGVGRHGAGEHSALPGAAEPASPSRPALDL
jgi:hypothetical protein